jgi:hypothetical protein
MMFKTKLIFVLVQITFTFSTDGDRSIRECSIVWYFWLGVQFPFGETPYIIKMGPH